MKYFEKIAVGPSIRYLPGLNEYTGSYGKYMAPGKPPRKFFSKKEIRQIKKKGIIYIDTEPLKSELPKIKKEFKDYSKEGFKKRYKWQNRQTQKDIKSHELVHYLRERKGKWSSKYYNIIPGARLIEESAAYGRGHRNKLKGFFNAVSTYRLGPIIKKILSIK